MMSEPSESYGRIAEEFERQRAEIKDLKHRMEVLRDHLVEVASANRHFRDGLRRIKDRDYDMDYSPEAYADAVLSGHEPQKE